MVSHTVPASPHCPWCHTATRCPFLAVACQSGIHPADGDHATHLVEIEEDGQRWRFASCANRYCLARLEQRGDAHIDTLPLTVPDAEDITGDKISHKLVAVA